MKKTLLYMGAGFDDSFLFNHEIRTKYNKFVLYDMLPNTSFYTQNEYGFTHVSSEKQFLKILKKNFGHYSRNKNRLYFPEFNIVYKLHTNCNTINHFCNGDVLIKNYVHPHIKEHLANRNILVNCDTVHMLSKSCLQNAELIHLPEFMYENKCYCKYVDQF